MTDPLIEIWQGILARDARSWEKLVRRLEPLVYSVLRKTGLSDSEADDCAQQTWIALYRSRHRISDPRSLPAWLIRVASRTAARTIRQRDSQQGRAGEIESQAPPRLPDEEIEQLERSTVLRLALEALDPRCRNLLRAIFLAPDQLKFREIAKRLGIPLNSIGPTRMRCLKKLRQILEAWGYDEVQKP